MQTSVNRARVLAIATTAFVAGIVFASSMDWTSLLGAQPRTAPVVSMAGPGGPDIQGGFVAIADQVTPAVVAIQAVRDPKPVASNRGQPRTQEELLRQFFGRPDDDAGPVNSSGTGFIVSKDGYVLTNNHVVAGMDRITVSLTDRRVFKARVIGRDPQTDVAVIKIDGSNLPTVTLGDDNATRVGEWVLAIGNPLGLDFTVTAGIVSAKGRSSELQSLRQSSYAIQDFIQTDAAINPGNSGGPLVNARGQVIGINSAIASRTGTYSGYGFAIPITLAKTVMDDIVAHGRVRRAIMGASMSEVNAEDAAINGLKQIAGAKIQDLCVADPQTGACTVEGPAEKAGVERGDIVVGVDGQPIDQVSTLQRVLRGRQPGDVVSLDIVRYGDKKTIKVKLAEAPSDDARPVAAATPHPESEGAVPGAAAVPKIGVSVETLTPKGAESRRLPGGLKGVVVASVTPGSDAEGKLFEDDVIVEVRIPGSGGATRTPVATVAELQKEIGKVRTGQYVSLLVRRVSDPRTGATVTSVVNLKVGE
ncbi:MAG: trypsin-like peptidase domain-containing protein [Gemmatimonadaceae bacterium]|nr:trypsin-like peptidase domain-containing protein [Gemmatimonadaceae bacterium]